MEEKALASMSTIELLGNSALLQLAVSSCRRQKRKREEKDEDVRTKKEKPKAERTSKKHEEEKEHAEKLTDILAGGFEG